MRGFHHVELWVIDLDRARTEWSWLLERLGFAPADAWTDGSSWRAEGAYLTICVPPGLRGARVTIGGSPPGSTTSPSRWFAQRRRPADGGGSGAWLERAVRRPVPARGRPPDHYAGWLENGEGFKAEVVATEV